MPLAYPLAFMSFGIGELLIIGTVALLVFGGQLPDVMRNLGRAYARLKEGLHEVSKPVRDELRQVTRLPDPRGKIRSFVDEVRAPLDQPIDVPLPPPNDRGDEHSSAVDGGTPWPGADAAEPDTGPDVEKHPTPPAPIDADDEPLPP